MAFDLANQTRFLTNLLKDTQVLSSGSPGDSEHCVPAVPTPELKAYTNISLYKDVHILVYCNIITIVGGKVFETIRQYYCTYAYRDNETS